MKTIAGEELDRKQGRANLFGKSIKLQQKLEDLEGNQKPDTIRTVIPFQLKSINDEDRTIEFVGSTAAVDRYGDSIIQAGWELKNFLQNPVVPWGHNYYQPPVAKALEVRLSEGKLVFKAQFATKDEYPWADTIYKLYKGGYLRAFSVGFIPMDWDGSWAEGYVFKQCELLEVSCVTVPANPEALVLAFGEGALSENERTAMIGQAKTLIKTLTDSEDTPHNDSMEAAEAIEELQKNMKAMSDQLTEIQKAVNRNDNGETEEPDNPEPDKPADDDPAGGTEEGEGAKSLDITPEQVREAVKGAVGEQLDYQLGKIK